MRAFVLTVALLAGGCGLQPIYAGGASGPAATTLAQISIAPISDRGGYFLREELVRRIGPGDAAPRYRLEVAIDDQITGFGIRGDTSISRERRALRARYRLIEIETNAVVLDATAGADAGIDVVQSEYAVVAAENSALERLAAQVAQQIATRVALYARAPR